MAKKDKIRDNYLENKGIKVLRFTDTDVLKNIEGVGEKILSVLKISEWGIYVTPLNLPLRRGEIMFLF